MYKRIAITVTVTLLAVTMAQSAAGQGRVAPDPDYRAPRTVDGQPNISGIWTNDTLTPFERPARLGDQEFYTEEQAAAIESRGREMLERDSAPGSTRTTASGSLDRGYNYFWSDPRETVVYTRRTSMIADPSTGRVPTRPEAEARARWLVANRTDSHENMSPYSRCITRGMPGSMIPNTYNTGNHIFQTPGYVVILYEMVREPRIIPLDDRPYIDPQITQWMGDARARGGKGRPWSSRRGTSPRRGGSPRTRTRAGCTASRSAESCVWWSVSRGWPRTSSTGRCGWRIRTSTRSPGPWSSRSSAT